MTNQGKLELYFIALVPPEPIFSEVNVLKRNLSEVHLTKASLRSPPHITLHMPFKWKASRESEIFKALDEVNSIGTLNVIQNGFGSFPPRVIYINVALSEGLKTLQRRIGKIVRTKLKIVKENYQGQAFHPHMTIAFRDLKPIHFRSAWAEYKSKSILFEWETTSFFLLKHSGKEWVLHKEFNFC